MAIETRIINGSFTELYTGGGNYMTQAKATHFHSFWTRKILAPTESIDDFKEVTAKEKAALEAADAAWERPPQSFIDAWNTRADYTSINKAYKFGQYNEETGYFELNTILDIDYPEAREIMQQSDCKSIGSQPYRFVNMTSKIRTLMPNKTDGSITGRYLAYDNDIQVIQLFGYFGTTLTHSKAGNVLLHSTNVRTVLGFIKINVNFSVTVCQKLEDICIYSDTKDGLTINLVNSPLLSLESINYTIDNSTKTLTIILHPDAYARVTEDMFEKAAAKGITITSA